jgi:DNA-binding NtrC family response regulator
MTNPLPPEKPAVGWPDWSILIVDDEQGMRNFLVKTLAPRCPFVMSAGSAEEGAEWLASHHVDLIILDISLPGKSGVTWLKELRAQGFLGEVILITAFADLDTAIEALRAGASDFMLKPFRVPQILNSVKQCVERARLQRENFVLRRGLAQQRGAHALVGQSRAMTELRTAVLRAADAPSTVLLQGESGTGKELVARELHAASPRAAGPFVPVKCSSLSPELMEMELFGQAHGAQPGGGAARDGLFYYAQGGTLFLDGVCELPLAVQASLARALEDLSVRPVGGTQRLPMNVRIIASTPQRLDEAVAQGRFRSDLCYRLKVVDLALPPLRDHKEDLPALVEHFQRELAPKLGVRPIAVSDEEMAYLTQYNWPGNCRELRNFVERSLILGGINVSALYPSPPKGGASPHATTDLATLEKRHIQAVLESVGGDKTQAARLLGVSRRTLERRVAEWNQT